MSGSPSTKFVGRSFNDYAEQKGYSNPDGLAEPAAGESFLLMAHLRINGAQLNKLESTEAPFGAIFVSLDTFLSPTKGIGLAVGAAVTGPDNDDSGLVFTAVVGGGGTNAQSQLGVTEATGGFGRDIFVHMALTEQQLGIGFNGKWGPPSDLGEDFEPAGAASYLGAVPGNPLNCNSGLVAIESVGIVAFTEEEDITTEDMAYAVVQAASASMKYGSMQLFDPQVEADVEKTEGVLYGRPWTHYWQVGTTDAEAPETLKDEGVGTASDFGRDIDPSLAPLIVADTGYGSGLLVDENPSTLWDGLVNPPSPAP